MDKEIDITGHFHCDEKGVLVLDAKKLGVDDNQAIIFAVKHSIKDKCVKLLLGDRVIRCENGGIVSEFALCNC